MRNATRQANHLEKCAKYKQAHPSKKRNVESLKLLSHQHSSSSVVAIEVSPTPGQINFPLLTAAQKHNLDLDSAISMYMGNQPFNTYDNFYHKKFLFRLNPAYTPPHPQSHCRTSARRDILECESAYGCLSCTLGPHQRQPRRKHEHQGQQNCQHLYSFGIRVSALYL
jgi:hypothetical protein